MYLILFCVFCVLSEATYGVKHGEFQKYGSLNLDSGVEKLLSKANLVNKFGSYRQYSRHGGQEQALKDFQSLKATDVTGSTISKRGHIGEVTVKMDNGVYKGREYTVLTFMTTPTSPRFRNELSVYTIRYFK